MPTPAVKARRIQSTELVARVLAAERTALSDVAQFRRRTEQFVLASCLRALLVQKRTELRIKRLRERMATAARLHQLRIDRQIQALEADTAPDESGLAALDQAIAKLTAELAGCAQPD